MKFLKTIVNRLFAKDSPKPMGRWAVEDCNKKLNKKIDLSNEDHCGPCGEYAIKKIEKIESKNKITNIIKK